MSAGKKEMGEMSIFATLSRDWIPLAENALCDDKDSIPMLMLLIKRYNKERIDYETFINSVEELLPVEQIADLLTKLEDICDPKENKLNVDRIHEVESKIEPSHIFCFDKKRLPPKIEVETKRYKFGAFENKTVELGNFQQDRVSRNGLTPCIMTPLAENVSQPILQNITCKVDNNELPPLPTCDLFETESISGSRRRNSRSSFSNVDVMANLRYIVHSLDRHSDPAFIKGDANIPEFQEIVDHAEDGYYADFEHLDNDLTELFIKLNRLGVCTKRVAKHYDNLVNYYFPAHGTRGKLRSGRT